MTQSELTLEKASEASTEHDRANPNGWLVRFLVIWTGQALSLLGSQVAGFAVLWWMTTTTGSAAVLATGALIDSLPRVFIGPLAGALIDRWNRRRVMIVTDGIAALAAAGLVYLGGLVRCRSGTSTSWGSSAQSVAFSTG